MTPKEESTQPEKDKISYMYPYELESGTFVNVVVPAESGAVVVTEIYRVMVKPKGVLKLKPVKPGSR